MKFYAPLIRALFVLPAVLLCLINVSSISAENRHKIRLIYKKELGCVEDPAARHSPNHLISPDNKLVAIALYKHENSQDTPTVASGKHEYWAIVIFNRKNKQCITVDRSMDLPQFSLLGFSPDSRYLAFEEMRPKLAEVIVTMNPYALEHVIKIWDTKKQEIVSTLKNLGCADAISSDGLIADSLIPSSFKVYSGGTWDTGIKLRDFKSGKVRCQSEPEKFSVNDGGIDFGAKFGCFSSDGKLFAISVAEFVGMKNKGKKKGNYAIRIYDTTNCKLITTLPIDRPYNNSLYLAFSPDSNMLISFGHDLTAWDIKSGKPLWYKDTNPPEYGSLQCLSVTDNRVAVYSQQGRVSFQHDFSVYIYDLKTGNLVNNITPDKDFFESLGIVLTTEDMRRQPINGCGLLDAMQLSQDGRKLLLTCGHTALKAKIYDIDSGTIRGEEHWDDEEAERILHSKK